MQIKESVSVHESLLTGITGRCEEYEASMHLPYAGLLGSRSGFELLLCMRGDSNGSASKSRYISGYSA